jgi:hypothetical protein
MKEYVKLNITVLRNVMLHILAHSNVAGKVGALILNVESHSLYPPNKSYVFILQDTLIFMVFPVRN